MNTNVQRQILDGVERHRDQIVAFLQSLIQINSTTGQEAQIQEFIVKNLKEKGLDVDIFELDIKKLIEHEAYLSPELSLSGRPNVVGISKGSGGGRSLLINGHVDTVPVEPVDQWLYGPFSGVVKEGCIYGRGASDMKSGLAAMTMAIGILIEIGLKPRGDVILEYTVDEERTGMGTLACILKGYKASAGICCETSNLEVMPACIGRMWFTIEVQGKPSGISARWESVSAIEKGIKIVQAIDDLEKMRIEDLRHPLYADNRGALPCAVTMFHSGTFPSVTPEKAILQGSFGMMPYEDPKDVQQQLIAQIDRLSRTDPWMRNNPPKVTFNGLVAQGAEIPSDHPIVNDISKAYLEVTGEKPIISGRKGGADTRFLIRYGNIPTVIFGPGITPQMHAMNEYVPLENLIIATKVLALTINDWCNNVE